MKKKYSDHQKAHSCMIPRLLSYNVSKFVNGCDLYACLIKKIKNEIKKSQNVILHQLAQKFPMNGLSPNLACWIVPRSAANQVCQFWPSKGFESIRGQNSIFPFDLKCRREHSAVCDYQLILIDVQYTGPQSRIRQTQLCRHVYARSTLLNVRSI